MSIDSKEKNQGFLPLLNTGKMPKLNPISKYCSSFIGFRIMAKKKPTDIEESENAAPDKEEVKLTEEESQRFHPDQIKIKREEEK